MTREDMIDAAFAAEEIGDVSQIDDYDDLDRFIDEMFAPSDKPIDNEGEDDDDEEFDRFIDGTLSCKPEKRSGAAKKRGRKMRAMINRALNRPSKPERESMSSLERLVFLGEEPVAQQ